nr:PREDICTED: microtubule-associated serine/threonine-protein kinase 4-like isoform X3 [Equus przewalskii]
MGAEDAECPWVENSLLDHILSPPPMPFRKCSNPDVASGPGKSLKFKRQLSEDGRQLRRGSLGGALTGRYLLPNPVAGLACPASVETSNLLRMRSQALGQSAPSLTASLLLQKRLESKLLPKAIYCSPGMPEPAF